MGHGHVGVGVGVVAGLMDVFGAAGFVAGTACYNRYLSRWSYRRILSAAGLPWRHPSRPAAAHAPAQPPCGLATRLHTRQRSLGRAEALQRSPRAALSQSGLAMSSSPCRANRSAVQLVLTAVNLLDCVWVSRWNLELGIPDAYFAMGYEALQPFAKRANLLPIFILAAKLCPPRAQAAAPTSRLYLPQISPISPYISPPRAQAAAHSASDVIMYRSTTAHLLQPKSHHAHMHMHMHMHMQTRHRPCS